MRAQAISFQVQLNPESGIYEGHFPDNPIAPGVCNIQMIMECVSQVLGFHAVINSIKRCRFLKPVIPTQQKIFEIEVRLADKENGIELEASLQKGLTSYLDFKGEIIKKE